MSGEVITWESWFDGDPSTCETARAYAPVIAAERFARSYAGGDASDGEVVLVRTKRAGDDDATARLFKVVFRMELFAEEVSDG